MHGLAAIRDRLALPMATALLAALFLVLPAITARAAVDIQDVRSDKGIEAWLVEDHTVPIVTIRFVFDGGSTQDPPGKEGLANLMTGLFDEGAGDLDSEAFQTRLDTVGAEMGFEENRDGIYGTMRMLAESKDAAFDLLRLAINEPRFDQGPIDRIRGQILSGILAGENDPNTVAQTRWLRAIYGDHPYSRPHEGTKQSVTAITADDLRAAHKAMFARNGLHVAVVGAIDAATLKTELDRLFGDLPEKQVLRPVADTGLKLAQQLQVDYDLPQTSLQMAFPGVKRSDPDFYAAALMNQIREKRGLAYNVSSALVDYDHASALVIATATRSDRAGETLAVIQDVVNRMVRDGPTEQELAAAKEYLIGAYAINNLNSSSAIASTLIELQLSHLGIDYIQRRAGYINAVTLDQVKAAARKLLATEPAVMVVGPPLGANGADTSRPGAAVPGGGGG